MSAIPEPPSEDAKAAAIVEFFGQVASIEAEQRRAIKLAQPALSRLVKACRENRCSGQILKVRSLLYSAWNGQATELNEILGLDWVLKKDLMTVLLAFGCEPSGSAPFFYDAVTNAMRGADLHDWFLAAYRPSDDDDD